MITVDIPTVESQAELLAPSHEVSEEAGILRMAVSGCLRVAAGQGALIDDRGLDDWIQSGDRIHAEPLSFHSEAQLAH